MSISKSNQTILEQIEKYGVTAAGNTNLKKYLKGKRLTQRQAILAKCAECLGYYADGRYDCEMPDCPLYPYMPYKGRIMPVLDD